MSSTHGHPLACVLAEHPDVTHAAHAVGATYESHTDVTITVRTTRANGTRTTPARTLLAALVDLEAQAAHLTQLVRTAVNGAIHAAE